MATLILTNLTSETLLLQELYTTLTPGEQIEVDRHVDELYAIPRIQKLWDDGKISVSLILEPSESDFISSVIPGAGGGGLDINGLPEDLAPDGAADFLATYDTSAGALRKVLLDNLPGGGGEANTASSVGVGGVSIVDGKVGIDLQFKSINAGSSKVTVTDDVANNEIDLDVVDGQIDHDALSNFVAAEHVDHSLVSVTAGEGLQGGGTIESTRTIDLDVNGLTADGSPDHAADYVATYDANAATHKKVLLSSLDHDALTNFAADEHVAHSGVTLTAGVGLTGGGTIAASRTFDLDINGLTVDGSPDGAADYVATYDANAAGHKKVLIDNLVDAGNVNAAGAVMHTDISESSGILRKTGSETYVADDQLQQGVSGKVTALTSGATVTPDLSNGNFFTLAPTENFEMQKPINVPGTGGGAVVNILITQDTTQRVITFATGITVNNGGNPILLSATPGTEDLLTLTTFNGGTTWQAMIAKVEA